MASGSGLNLSGLIDLAGLPSNLEQSGSGSLHALKVQSVSSQDNQYNVTASLGDSTINFTASSRIPDGSILLGRLQETRGDFKLQVLTESQQMEQVKTQSLMKLLQGQGVLSGDADPEKLQSMLKSKGYLSPEKMSKSDIKVTSKSGTGPTNANRKTRVLTVTEASQSSVRNMSEGSVVEAQVTKQEGREATLKIGSRDVTVRAQSPPEEGAVLKVKAQNTETAPTLHVQSTSSVSVDTGLLQSITDALNVDRSKEVNEILKSIITAKGDSPSDKIDQIQSQFASVDKTFTPETRQKLSESIQNYQRNPDPKTLERIKSLLNLNGKDEINERVKSLLVETRNTSPENVLDQFVNEFTTVSRESISESQERLQSLIKKFQQTVQIKNTSGSTLRNLEQLTDQQLTELLRNMGFEPDERTLKATRTIIETDPSPSKETLRQTLKNLGMAQSEDGKIDTNRMKTVLFLAKNDLPVKENWVNLLQHAAPGGSENSMTETLQALKGLGGVESDVTGQSAQSVGESVVEANFNPDPAHSSEQLSQKLFDTLKTIGFDVEAKVANQPDQASETLRSRLMNLQRTLASSATDKLMQAIQTGDSKLQDQSRQLLSQLFKYSLASVAEDDSIFLFVPFPDEEKTGLMRLRFEDDSEGDQVDDESWTVTINLDMSQLGPIQVQAQRHQRRLNLTFRASLDRTLDRIENSQDTIVELLGEKGYDVSVRTTPWQQSDQNLLDWDLYFDKSDLSGTFDVTV